MLGRGGSHLFRSSRAGSLHHHLAGTPTTPQQQTPILSARKRSSHTLSSPSSQISTHSLLPTPSPIPTLSRNYAQPIDFDKIEKNINPGKSLVKAAEQHMMEERAEREEQARMDALQKAQEALEALREIPEHEKAQKVVITDQYVLFSATKVVQEKFFLFQKEQDRLILEEYDKRMEEREVDEKRLKKKVHKLLSYRHKEYKARAHNPPKLFEEVFDAFSSDHSNAMANAARKWGLNPGVDAFNEVAGTGMELGPEAGAHSTELYDNLENEEYFVYNNLNKLRFSELTWGIDHDDYGDMSALASQEKVDYRHRCNTIEEIGIYGYDPVQIMEAKRKHWEGLAGSIQEELRKIGMDAAPRDWPFYPSNVPVLVPLRDFGKNAIYEDQYFHELPEGSLTWYLNFFRKRLHTDADPDRLLPRYDPEEPTVRITRDQHWEPIVSKKMSKDRQFLTKRVRMLFKIDDLQLPPLAKERMIAILGTRYNPETGEVYMSADKKPSARENTLFLKHVVKELMHESLLACPQYISPSENDVPRLLPPPTGHSKVKMGPDEGYVVFHFPPPEMQKDMSLSSS